MAMLVFRSKFIEHKTFLNISCFVMIIAVASLHLKKHLKHPHKSPEKKKTCSPSRLCTVSFSSTSKKFIQWSKVISKDASPSGPKCGVSQVSTDSVGWQGKEGFLKIMEYLEDSGCNKT